MLPQCDGIVVTRSRATTSFLACNLRKLLHSSGNPVVDRRAGYAEALAAEQSHSEAAEVMAQALEEAPGWALGWSNLGRYHEGAGDIAAAIAAWQRSAELDREGVYGAALKLMAHGVGSDAQGAAYVETLFDDYAMRFERSLVDRLEYRAPRDVMAMLGEVGRPAGGTAYDLGCGTGLMGVELRPNVRRLEGVDISGAMLEEARRKGVYNRLVKGELSSFLEAAEPAELMTATDVLNYVGPLPPVLARVHDRLLPGGLFAFSLELNDGLEPVKLRSSLRYAHNGAAAQAACLAAGFEVVRKRETVLRRDRGAPVPGLLLVVRRS
jgi:predicted TPR repeat methyltransferase